LVNRRLANLYIGIGAVVPLEWDYRPAFNRGPRTHHSVEGSVSSGHDTAAFFEGFSVQSRYWLPDHPLYLVGIFRGRCVRTVVAAVLLLHEHSVNEIAPDLSAIELEQVIKLVGRSPRLYPPGILDALNQRRTSPSPQPPSDSAPSIVAAKDAAGARGIGLPRGQERPPRSEHGAGADAGAGSPRSAEGNTGPRL
jgi:hypothetical protein